MVDNRDALHLIDKNIFNIIRELTEEDINNIQDCNADPTGSIKHDSYASGFQTKT